MSLCIVLATLASFPRRGGQWTRGPIASGLLAALAFSFELPAVASPQVPGDFVTSGSDTGTQARLVLETPLLTKGVVVLEEVDNYDTPGLRFVSGLALGYEVLHSCHLNFGVASEVDLLWTEQFRAPARLLAALASVEFRVGGTWWPGSRTRVDHQLGLGGSVFLFARDTGRKDQWGVGPFVSLRNTVTSAISDRTGFLVGVVMSTGRPKAGNVDYLDGPTVFLLMAQVRLGVAWALI